MAGDTHNTGYNAARRMLEAFASVEAETFDLTTTTRAGEKAEFRRLLTSSRLSRMLRGLLAAAETTQHNVIVRPYSDRAVLVQLDDLDARDLAKVKPVAFLVLNTSPGNHQAWVAVSDPGDPDFARRLKRGAGADPTASGATRVAGSVNFKDKYAPNFPRVAIAHISPRLIVSKTRLEELGLVAAPEEPPARVSRPPARGRSRQWPDYERCVREAPRNHGDTAPDISRAEFTWCMIAIDWGFPVELVAERLLEASSKAREQGDRYAALTAGKAAEAVARRRPPNAKPNPV